MKEHANGSFFSSICLERCKGMCCDPWWGIISYTAVKRVGASLDDFRDELTAGIEARAKRITANYATSQGTPLFGAPEKYNVSVRDIRVSGGGATMELMAMFAFRCRFLSPEKRCAIHPSITGKETRPPHCGFMGSPGARPNERGYCRIIHAAALVGDVAKAIEIERSVSLTHYRGGTDTAGEAAERVIERLKSYCAGRAPEDLNRYGPLPGRNEPCWCGSSLKYKKCHGR